jgi:hypothetical protein
MIPAMNAQSGRILFAAGLITAALVRCRRRGRLPRTRSAGPVRPFQDIARRHSGLGGKIDEVDRTIAAVGGGKRLPDHRIGFGILCELQMCVACEIASARHAETAREAPPHS